MSSGRPPDCNIAPTSPSATARRGLAREVRGAADVLVRRVRARTDQRVADRARGHVHSPLRRLGEGLPEALL